MIKHGVEKLGDRFVFRWDGEEVALEEFNKRLQPAKTIAFDEIRDMVSEANEKVLLADGFEDALIGYAEAWLPCESKKGKITGCSPGAVALYDRGKCIEILMKRDGMTDEEAMEFFDFNVTGAYMGEGTPAFATIFRRS